MVAVLHERLRGRAVVPGALLGAVGLALQPSLDRRFPVPSKSLIDLARAVDLG